jgi:hypothetical protein
VQASQVGRMNALLPRRITKKPKRESRWKSPAHLTFVRGFCCANCGSDANIQAAHVRLGSGTGMGQKPDDWRAVPLCGGDCERDGCHTVQHQMGEETFWRDIAQRDPEELIKALIQASPKRHEIEQVMKERGS